MSGHDKALIAAAMGWTDAEIAEQPPGVCLRLAIAAFLRAWEPMDRDTPVKFLVMDFAIQTADELEQP